LGLKKGRKKRGTRGKSTSNGRKGIAGKAKREWTGAMMARKKKQKDEKRLFALKGAHKNKKKGGGGKEIDPGGKEEEKGGVCSGVTSLT